MITAVQRVLRARVIVDGETVGEIDRGLLLFVGVEEGDTTVGCPGYGSLAQGPLEKNQHFLGAKQAILKSSGDADVRLLYIPAGSELPDHGHHGQELTLVLQGAFIDGDDRFARGDLEVADEDLEHTPVADIGEDRICLAATNAPLKFKGIAPRLAQPFLRI